MDRMTVAGFLAARELAGMIPEMTEFNIVTESTLILHLFCGYAAAQSDICANVNGCGQTRFGMACCRLDFIKIAIHN